MNTDSCAMKITFCTLFIIHKKLYDSTSIAAKGDAKK